MDEELRDLEAELRRLRPSPPSAALRARLHGALDRAASAPVAPRPATAPASKQGWWWPALAAAAAVALFFTLRVREPSGKIPVEPVAPQSVAAGLGAAGAFKPVAAENLLYATDDEGWVTLGDGTPARRERLHFVDTITWRNPRTNASLTWSLSREEVRITPVTFH